MAEVLLIGNVIPVIVPHVREGTFVGTIQEISGPVVPATCGCWSSIRHFAVGPPQPHAEGLFCCDYSCSCFPSASTVNLDNGKSVAMSELQVGDRVQTGIKSVAMSELQVGDRVQTGMKSVAMSEFQLGDRV